MGLSLLPVVRRVAHLHQVVVEVAQVVPCWMVEAEVVGAMEVFPAVRH